MLNSPAHHKPKDKDATAASADDGKDVAAAAAGPAFDLGPSAAEATTFEGRRELRKSTANFTFMAASIEVVDDDEGDSDSDSHPGGSGGPNDGSRLRATSGGGGPGGGGSSALKFQTRGVLKLATRDGVSNLRVQGVHLGQLHKANLSGSNLAQSLATDASGPAAAASAAMNGGSAGSSSGSSSGGGSRSGGALSGRESYKDLLAADSDSEDSDGSNEDDYDVGGSSGALGHRGPSGGEDGEDGEDGGVMDFLDEVIKAAGPRKGLGGGSSGDGVDTADAVALLATGPEPYQPLSPAEDPWFHVHSAGNAKAGGPLSPDRRQSAHPLSPLLKGVSGGPGGSGGDDGAGGGGGCGPAYLLPQTAHL